MDDPQPIVCARAWPPRPPELDPDFAVGDAVGQSTERCHCGAAPQPLPALSSRRSTIA